MQDPLYAPKKNRRESSAQFDLRHPHPHRGYFQGRDISRRLFFQLAGSALTGSMLAPHASAQTPVNIVDTTGAATLNTAKNVIFILLTGAISQMDSFDLKVTSDTPAALEPTMIGDVNWPAGLLPKLGGHLDDIAIIRSMSAWALVHPLAQTWVQIGRNPAAALGDIAPNLGSVVAIEKDPERLPGQVFPAFIALNSAAAAGPGYFSTSYAPFHVIQPRSGTGGIPNTTNPLDAQNTGIFDALYTRLQQYAGGPVPNTSYGDTAAGYSPLYEFARGMMYNPQVEQAFTLSDAERERYGNSSFGDVCAVANKVVTANQGTRFVQINFGNWDHHADIYGEQNPNGNNLFTIAPDFDNGLSALLDDLKASGQINDTLVVALGEFGRTPGISAAGGRDHYLLLSAMMAGGGVKGGRIIGATNANGSDVTEFGWNGSGDTGPRLVRPEDIESTIYSAMGIDWTTIRYDDPFKRGFEYVPFARNGKYGPVHELFT